MKRLLHPAILIFTVFALVMFAYLTTRLATGPVSAAALAIPFILVWLIPVLYWFSERQKEKLFDAALHYLGYLSMGWISFVLVFSLLRDLILLLASWFAFTEVSIFLQQSGGLLVLGLTAAALVVGAFSAWTGPRMRDVEIPIVDLHPDLEGFRIVQITDLHVGPTIKKAYVEKVVELANSLRPNMIALTGDMVDGRLVELGPHVAALSRLDRTALRYFVVGNHEYYSHAGEWIEYFRSIDIRPLLNAHVLVRHGEARLLVGGVLDPAAGTRGGKDGPDAKAAMRVLDGSVDAERFERSNGVDLGSLKILLAHNPKIAKEAELAGFDLQLSGHTHAGQFFPWTIVAKLVHAPHFFGLSKSGKMWVYVSAGTGTWGPPVRFGTTPEITLLRLMKAKT